MNNMFSLIGKSLNRLSSKYLILLRRSSSQEKWEEIRIPVPWGHIAGKWWGPTDKRPVLSLHGWQDNCGTFNRLIPLLQKENLGFLAIDLPGHGYSSRLPRGMYNYFFNHVIVIQQLVNYFQWSKVSLMGHSMGGGAASLYSMFYPDKVDFLILIDILKPILINENPETFAETVSKKIDYFLKNEQYHGSAEEPPAYTLEEVREKICSPNNNSIDGAHFHHIMERNVAPSKKFADKYYFSRDPRLRTGPLLNWAQTDLVTCAKSLTCPILVIKATKSSYYEDKRNFYEVLDVIKSNSKDCVFLKLDGTHHIHLNSPGIVAEHITKFIDKHDVEDRNLGGIKVNMRYHSQ